MEFLGTARVTESGPIQLPWNFTEFHISKNFLIIWLKIAICMRNRMLTSITSKFQWVLHMLQTPLRSMQLQIFYFYDKRAFMEFHGTACGNEVDTLQVPWNSMEFHGTAPVLGIGLIQACISKIGALQIPWNSIKLLGSTKLAHLNFHGIPSNSRQLQNIHFYDKISCMEFNGTACVNDIGALQVPWNFVEIELDNMLTAKLYRDTQNNCTRDNTWNSGKL